MKLLFLSAAMFLCAAIAGFTGPTSEQAGSKPSGELPTISWFIDNTWYQAEPKWGTSTITRFLQKELGLSVEASNPSEDKGERLNLMIAAGDLPDMITEPDLVRWSRIVQAKIALPLDKKIAKLPSLHETVPDWLVKQLREADGSFYGLPWIFATTPSRGRLCLMYNQGLYAKMGSPSVATFEEFEAALVKAKAMTNVDGKPVIPLSFSAAQGILQLEAMIHLQAGQGVLNTAYLCGSGLMAFGSKDGPYDVTRSDAFRNSIMLLRKWYQNGLIDKEGFIQTEEQYRSKILGQQVAFSLENYWGLDLWGGGSQQQVKAQNHYWGMKPPVDKTFKGELKNWPFASSPVGRTCVMAASAKVDAALKFLNFAVSRRGQFILWDGYDPTGAFSELEGVNWTRSGKGNKLIYTDSWGKEMAELGHMGIRNKYGRFWNNPILAQDIEAEYMTLGDRDLLDAMTKAWAWDAKYAAQLDPAANTPELAQYQKCITIGNSALARIVVAESQAAADDLFARMLKDLDEAGIGNVVAVWKANYEANVKKFK